jgi:hypothetical protein
MNIYIALTTEESLAAYQQLQGLIQGKLDEMWDTHFFNSTTPAGGGIFGVVCTTMIPIALIALVLTFAQEFYKNGKSVDIRIAEKLVMHILVLSLLLGDGGLLKVAIGGLRGAGNIVTANVLELMQASASINGKILNTAGDQQAIARFKTQASECSNGPSIERTACYDKLRAGMETAASSGEIRNANLLDKLQNLAGKIGGALASGDLGKVSDLTAGELTKLNPINNMLVAFFNYLMAGVAAAIQLLLEISALLTALIAPVYITMAIMPSGGKAIASWLSTFWGIFLFKLCYSITIGFSASFYDLDGINAMYMGIVSSFLAPLLASILAAGGGMGFFNAAVSIGGQVADAGLAMATSGGSAAAKGAASAGQAISVSKAADASK